MSRKTGVKLALLLAELVVGWLALALVTHNVLLATALIVGGVVLIVITFIGVTWLFDVIDQW